MNNLLKWSLLLKKTALLGFIFKKRKLTSELLPFWAHVLSYKEKKNFFKAVHFLSDGKGLSFVVWQSGYYHVIGPSRLARACSQGTLSFFSLGCRIALLEVILQWTKFFRLQEKAQRNNLNWLSRNKSLIMHKRTWIGKNWNRPQIWQ